MRLRLLPSLKAVSCCSRHQLYSSSVSPFQAKLPTCQRASSNQSDCYLHWNTGTGNGSGGVILRRKNVAARPCNLGAQVCECLNENSGLDGCCLSVKRLRELLEENQLMCKQPAIRAPFNGWSSAYFSRVAMRPGISFSANSISRRPKAAKLMSATLNLLAGALILKFIEKNKEQVLWKGTWRCLKLGRRVFRT